VAYCLYPQVKFSLLVHTKAHEWTDRDNDSQDNQLATSEARVDVPTLITVGQ